MSDTVEVTFDFSDLADEIGGIVEDAVAEGVYFAEREIRKRVPSNRAKTLQSVESESNELEGEIKFDFRKKYDPKGTKTERILTAAWVGISSPTFEVIKSEVKRKL